MKRRDWIGILTGVALLVAYVSYNLGQDVTLDQQGTAQRVQMLVNATSEK